MDLIFSTRALQVANDIAKKTHTPEAKIEAARIAEDHMTGLALFYGAAMGPIAAAEVLYRLADHLAVQETTSHE